MSTHFRLITGRTVEQCQGLHQGKNSGAYRQATALIEMNAEDMARLNIASGQTVLVRAGMTQMEVPARAGTVPPGVVFMPLGPVANALIASDTQGTGMPLFKGAHVEVEPRTHTATSTRGGTRGGPRRGTERGTDASGSQSRQTPVKRGRTADGGAQ